MSIAYKVSAKLLMFRNREKRRKKRGNKEKRQIMFFCLFPQEPGIPKGKINQEVLMDSNVFLKL